jgi:hypothetical protein
VSQITLTLVTTAAATATAAAATVSMLKHNRVADHHGLSALAAAIEQRMHSVFSPAVDAMDTDDYYSSSYNNTAAAAAYRPADTAEHANDDTDEPGWRRALKTKSGSKKLGPLAQVCI